jgi:hypothetical protein
MRFVPDGTHEESATVSFCAWDQTGATSGQQGTTWDATTHGGSTPFSDNTQAATLEVIPIKDLIIKRFESTGVMHDRLGLSVSVSGDWAIAGAYNDTVGSNGAQGSATIFYRNEGGANNWGEVKQITASDGAQLDEFGCSVSISGDWAIVGARYADDGGNADEGVAYIFNRNQGGTNNWGQAARITGSDAGASDWFGWSVSIDGNWAVVGAVTHDLPAGANAGSAYVFHWDGSNWSEATKLTAPPLDRCSFRQ